MRKTRLSALIGALFPAIQGQPQSLVMNGAAVDQIGLINALLNVNPWPAGAYNAASNTTGFTATQSQIILQPTSYETVAIPAGWKIHLIQQ